MGKTLSSILSCATIVTPAKKIATTKNGARRIPGERSAARIIPSQPFNPRFQSQPGIRPSISARIAGKATRLGFASNARRNAAIAKK